MRTSLLICLLIASSLVTAAAKIVPLTITNPLDVDRPNAVVIAPASLVIEGLQPCTVVAEVEDGDDLPLQLDDLDGDNIADEMVMVLDLEAKQSINVRVNTEKPWPGGWGAEARTNWLGREFAVLDTEQIAYRVYEFHKPVDLPGALQWDCYGKRPAAWRLSVGALAKVNYHKDNPVGVDFLKIGRSLGLGGLILGEGRPVMGETAQYSHKVVTNGPLRAALQIDIADWTTPAGGRYEAIAQYHIYAHNDFIEARLTVTPLAAKDERLGAGIVKHDTQEQFVADETLGILAAWGRQDAIVGESGLAIVFPPEQFHSFVDRGGDENAHAVFLNPSMTGQAQVAARMWFVGVWEHGGVATEETFLAHMEDLSLRFNHPTAIARRPWPWEK